MTCAAIEMRRHSGRDSVADQGEDFQGFCETNGRFVSAPSDLPLRLGEQVFDASPTLFDGVNEGVPNHTLSGPEAAWDGCGASLRDREQEIEDPLARDQRNRGHESLLHGPWPSNRPCLEHLNLFAVVEFRDDLVDFEGALADLGDLAAAEVRGDHDAVLDVLRLLDRPDHVARPDGRAFLRLRDEGPCLLPGKARQLHTAEN